MYELRIDNQVYKANYEFPVTYTLDKSLDFGSIILPLIDRRDPFPMYSTIEITRDNNEKEYFIVSGDIVKIASYSPLLFSHTIQFVEYTKKLETYLISAATFTQPTDGTTRYTYYDVIDRLVKISVFETATREAAAIPCVLDLSTQSLDSIKAPEFFFYNKTLREALDEVLGTLPAIARLKRINDVDTLFVDYLDITGALVNKEIFLTYDGEQNITNYSTTMVSDLTNAIRGTKGLESITYYPNSEGWAVLSVPDNVGIIDDARGVIDLKQGIYDMVELQAKAQVQLGVITVQNDETTIEREITVDLSRFVVTKEQYEALNGSWIDGPTNDLSDEFPDLPPGITQAEMIEQGILNKQNAIWFEPGTPFIQGLATNWRGTFFSPETQRRRSLENALLTAMNKQEIIDEAAYKKVYRLEIGRNVEAIIPSNRERWELFMFRALFIPQEKANRVETERLDLSSFSKKAFSYFKQNANLINLNAYINKMNADLQRTGEEMYVTNALHSSYDNLLNLGDYTEEGYILVTRTVTQQKDYIEVNYNFSKNYQQINERIAVDKSNDFFELVSGDKVLDRFLTYKDYVILSSVAPNYAITETLLTNDGEDVYLNTFDNNEDPQLIESWNMIRFPNVKQYAPVAGSGAGSSLLLSSGFNHNAIAGFVTIFDLETGGYVQSPSFYAFDGELEEFDIEFYDRFSNATDDFNTELTYARALPLVDRTDYNVLITNVGKNIGSFKPYKDPGERIKFNYQIQAIVSPDSIGQFIIGNYFHNYNGLVHQPKETLYIHFSSDLYDKGDIEQVKRDPSSPFGSILDANAGPFNVLTISNTIPANTNSYGVSDSSGKLLFAVNRVDGTLVNQVRFTFTHDRPGLQKL